MAINLYSGKEWERTNIVKKIVLCNEIVFEFQVLFKLFRNSLTVIKTLLQMLILKQRMFRKLSFKSGIKFQFSTHFFIKMISFPRQIVVPPPIKVFFSSVLKKDFFRIVLLFRDATSLHAGSAWTIGSSGSEWRSATGSDPTKKKIFGAKFRPLHLQASRACKHQEVFSLHKLTNFKFHIFSIWMFAAFVLEQLVRSFNKHYYISISTRIYLNVKADWNWVCLHCYE